MLTECGVLWGEKVNHPVMPAYIFLQFLGPMFGYKYTQFEFDHATIQNTY